MPERAVIFDLDDTLYPHRRFVLSGFRAVATLLQETRGADARATFNMLATAFRRGKRGREIQELRRLFDLSDVDVTRLVAVIRDHVPSVRLPQASANALEAMRPDWRIGVLTNGLPAVQDRKVTALGLAGFVDAVVFAGAPGLAGQKPAASGFFAALTRLGVTPASAVFVGDDRYADMLGAASVGMKTIHVIRRGEAPCDFSRCHAHVRSLAEVPHTAAGLLLERSARHVA